MNTLHYIYDPMCGWCYAAAPLIAAARRIDGLNIEMHAGGMWLGDQVKKVTPQLRGYVLSNDERIAQLTGQPFGEGYKNGLLTNTQAVLDSEPPIRAVLAAQQLAGKGLDCLAAIQTAHFVEGREVSRLATLSDIAESLGLNRAEFEQQFAGVAWQNHLQQSHQLMGQWGIQGYPSLLLQRGDEWGSINHSAFYGHPDDFAEQLKELIGVAA